MSKKTIHTITFLSEISHTIKIQNFDHQNWSNVIVLEPIFFCQAEQILIFLGT